jgi:hypothetical protein
MRLIERLPATRAAVVPMLPAVARHDPLARRPAEPARPAGQELGRVLASHRAPHRALEDRGAAPPDEEHRRLQAPDAGVVAPDAGTKAPARSASLAISGDGSYSDGATASHKKVTFDVTWSGGAKENYIVVNWWKGFMRNPTGKPYKASLYGKSAEIEAKDWMVDSTDADPAYWSDSSGRWNYTVGGPGKFSATDDPGPMYTSDGKGAEAYIDYRTAVYRSADVPTTTTGTIAAKPLHAFQTWSYHVVVDGGGKFTHKK